MVTDAHLLVARHSYMPGGMFVCNDECERNLQKGRQAYEEDLKVFAAAVECLPCTTMHVELVMLMLSLCKVNLESKGIHDICTGLINLPGWCWAEIQQFALVGSSSSLHSEACNALGASDGVIHSRISLEVVCF